MYEAFYNLKDQPFRLTSDPAFMYMTVNHREALAGLVYSACTRPGLMVLTGEAGTGKTTLLYTLVELLEKRRFVTAVCTNPVLTREELFDFLLQTFAVNCPSSLKSRQLLALQDMLMRTRMDGRPAVLVVDEAHRLSLELLEEIRLLLNFETRTEKLLQIVMAGQPELAGMLNLPQLRQFKQRVSCHCKLSPLTPAEVKEYIDHRLAYAGLPHQQIFPDAAIDKISEYSGGIPRVVNTLCDASLQTGFALRLQVISPSVVDEAAGDLDMVSPRLPAELEAHNPIPIPQRPKPVNGHAAAAGADGNGHGNGNGNGAGHVPLESYGTRQKTVSFFGNLIDRWR